MTLADPALPYGIRDIKVTPINSDGSYGTSVDLPVAQTLSFSEAEEYEELRGDDQLVAVHGKGPTVEFDLEAGGISLEAWQVMSGGTLGSAGTTPNQTKTLLKKITQSRPYFKIEGQIINDVDGDTHVVIYKAKITSSIEGEFADGGFFVTKCSGQGLGNNDDDLYLITWNETSASIGAGVNELQLIVSNGTGGTFTTTYSGQTTGALAFGLSISALQTALEALSNVVPGEVLVSGAPGAWYVEFIGTKGSMGQTQMTVDNTNLTGGDAAVTTIRQGAVPS